MRPLSLAFALVALQPSLASDVSHWSTLASRSRTGVIKLNAESYEELLSSDRDYSVSVVLTALPAQFKCQPCHEFDPSFHQVAGSWKRQPQMERDQHFFAQLDFSDGQAVYQQVPTLPSFMGSLMTGTPARLDLSPDRPIPPRLDRAEEEQQAQRHHLRPQPKVRPHSTLSILHVLTSPPLPPFPHSGLTAPPFHSFITHLTPSPFELYIPTNPWPLILTPLLALIAGGFLYGSWPFLLPLVQSRLIWGAASICLILTFTSGYMWNKIKGAPYVAVDQSGKTSWIAGGYQNQLGLESQVVASTYGLLGFCIIALTIFVPAQSSPMKQRIGVYLWLGLLIVVFSLLMKLFRIKNGGYPFGLLF